MTDPAQTPSSRRRGQALEQALLQAAQDELAERGYAHFTMEGVARRAGTNKNTLYRRWPNRAALAIAAYRQFTVQQTRVPDTGSLREDILQVLRQAHQHLASPSSTLLHSLLSGIRDDPELLVLLQTPVSDPEVAPWILVLERAVSRGEAPAQALHPRVAAVPIALLRNEHLTRGVQGVTEQVLTEIVDEVYLPLVQGRGQ